MKSTQTRSEGPHETTIDKNSDNGKVNSSYGSIWCLGVVSLQRKVHQVAKAATTHDGRAAQLRTHGPADQPRSPLQSIGAQHIRVAEAR